MILCPLLHVIYTSDISEIAGTTMATFADETVTLLVARSENEAKYKLQNALTYGLNSSKSTHVDFTKKKINFIFMDSIQVPHIYEAVC